MIRAVNVHEVELASGRRTLSDFSDVPLDTIGSADRIVYDGIQINHYQAKTRSEFDVRMRLPRAAAPHLSRMNDRDVRFALLDRNEVEDDAIVPFHSELRRRLAAIS